MELVIRRPDDWHVHLRQGQLLCDMAPFTARHFARALVMPNLVPSIVTADEMVRYRTAIEAVVPGFLPLMTVKITDTTTPEMLAMAHAEGAVAGKAYPINATTHSADGVSDFRALTHLWEAMEEIGMVLSLHGEDCSAFCLDREAIFLFETLSWLVETFPRLRIVLEHVSSSAAITTVSAMPETVAATITAHHLVLTLDDVVAGKLHPHHYCAPIAKRPGDRTALRQAAMSGNPKFFFGSDSAPHARNNKECDAGMPGIFTAPVALAILAELFEEGRQLDRLEAFTSEFGARFYQLPPNEGTVKLIREPWIVPADYHGVVPLFAGKELAWQVG